MSPYRSDENEIHNKIQSFLSFYSLYGEAMIERALELLDTNYMPIPPQPNCSTSMVIYEDHRLMAAEYMSVKNQCSTMKEYKAALEAQLQEEEFVGEEDEEEDPQLLETLLRLQEEKESLLKCKDDLSTQLLYIQR